VLAGLLALAAACGPAPAAPAAEAALTVFAAASLTEAFTAIAADFQAEHPGVTITFNFAGSNQLAEQINQGAPADVFASANSAQMAAAVEGGRIAPGAPQTFARNRLVVILPAGNSGGLAALRDLARPGLRLVLAAQAVPVGQYSLDFLDKAGRDAAYGAAFKEAVLANVVSYEENVRAVLTKVALGEADAGIVYTSDVTGEAAAQVDRLDIPDELNTLAAYPIAPLADSARPEAAQAFVEFVLSASGQEILAEHGFIPAGSP
jgi:molybdate transport system substrate-binding protein